MVLNDGFEVRARAVVSTLSGPGTFLDLVGDAALSDDLVNACRDWEWQETSLLTCHYGYKGEAPTYYSAQFDADANNAYIHVFGVDNAGDVENIHKAIARGEIAEGHGRAICATQFDEFHAGFGQMNRSLQTLRFETLVPSRLASREWADVGKSQRESALALWRRYATGVVDGTLSYSSVVTPPELQRRLPGNPQASFLGGKYTARRMGYGCATPACSQYRSEIESLFMGGATTHPGGLGHFAAGYNAAGLVASSLGLNGRWDEPAFVQAARANGYLPGAGGQ